MITTLAVHGYRSLLDLVLPLAPVTVITGENGAGKSSLYRALRLLAATAQQGVIGPLAADGGLERVLWAGPEVVSRGMRLGEIPVQGGARRTRPVSLMMGVTFEELGYLIDIGLPQPGDTVFRHDPVIKREEVFVPPLLRPSARVISRQVQGVVVPDGRRQRMVLHGLSGRLSMLSELADPDGHPELLSIRRSLQQWRFYDSFRTDTHAPARRRCLTTWTPVLAEDGHDLAAAIATILESAWREPFNDALSEAFPDTGVWAEDNEGHLTLRVQQRGMLRPLTTDELSDGTLRFLLLAAALLSPQPPELLVLNEPETSLHPQVLPVLARLITQVAERTQVIVVSHSQHLVAPLVAIGDEDSSRLMHHHLVKDTGVTMVEGQGLLTTPRWEWGRR